MKLLFILISILILISGCKEISQHQTITKTCIVNSEQEIALNHCLQFGDNNQDACFKLYCTYL